MNDTETPQYTQGSIKAYEQVYGPDFVSPGGLTTARSLLANLELERGQRALDVGSGLGGCAFLLAREFGLIVDGMDFAPEMVEMARTRLAGHGLEATVSFDRGDIQELDRPSAYQLIHGREVFLHIADKSRLFRTLGACLAPGGQLFFTDYMRGTDDLSPGFLAYIERYGYSLHTLDEYRDILEAAGYKVEEAVDQTDEFLRIHAEELAAMKSGNIPEPYRGELIDGWQAKIDRAQRSEQRWGRFRLRKKA